MHKRNPAIARAMLWAALILLALSVYEVATRMDAMWGPLKMFVNMAVGERIPLNRVMLYVDMSIFHTPLFMLGCAILAVWALFARRSRRASAALILPAAVLTALGFTLRLTLFGEMVRTLKLLPLVFLLILCVLHAVIRPARPHREPLAGPQPVHVPPPPIALQPQVIVQRRRRSERKRAS